jgi:hypothetical protein
MKVLYKFFLFIIWILIYSTPVLSSDEDTHHSKRQGTPVEKLEKMTHQTSIKKRKTEEIEEIEEIEEESINQEFLINDLSDEIITHIFTFFDLYEFFDINIVCKKWNVLTNQPELWRYRPIKESRVETKSLMYLYKGQCFDFGQWEDHVKNLIKSMTSSINKIPQLKSLNIALAQLSIVYEEGPEKIEKVDFMLPHFFMSRWPDDREKTDIEVAFSKAKQQYLVDNEHSMYGHFHVGNGKNFSWKGYYPEFKKHLRNIIPLNTEEKSRLIKRRINRRIQQINDTTRAFTLWYLHSEQAVLIYLKEQMSVYLPELLNKISKEETVISHVLLNMVSYNDMCERCGDTYFRECENGKGFINTLNSVIVENGYKIPFRGINFFVACSGLEKYPSDDGTILRDSTEKIKCSIPHKDEEVINLLNYNPAVAQHYIN